MLTSLLGSLRDSIYLLLSGHPPPYYGRPHFCPPPRKQIFTFPNQIFWVESGQVRGPVDTHNEQSIEADTPSSCLLISVDDCRSCWKH